MIELLAVTLAQIAAAPTAPCDQQPEADGVEFAYEGSVDYFPLQALNAGSCDWYSGHLFSLQHAPLRGGDAVFRLRFLELPSRDYPLAVTVSQNRDGTAMIEARATDGTGGFGVGKLVYQQQSTLSARELAYLTAEIERARLCRPHPDDHSLKLPDGGVLDDADGTRNVFEWASGDQYCVRDAIAREDSELTKLAIWLVRRVYSLQPPPPAGLP